MKTIYLLIAFIAVTTMFFYFVSALIQQTGSNGAGALTSNAGSADNAGQPSAIKNQQQSTSTTSPKNPVPTNFQGPPPGKPGEGFHGPTTPPPPY